VHVLLIALALHGSAAPVSRAELGKSWHPGCPVAPAQLRTLRVSYWGFDGKHHTGTLVVNVDVVDQVSAVFGRLDRARFPIRRMTPIAAYGGSDDRSMAADNTSAFNCRYAVASGPKHWSAHAYGEAVDVNPVENPYVGCGQTRERRSRPYLDRARLRPGMVTPRVVAAFRSIGWGWGGGWSGSTKDYMHFSASGH